MPLDPTSWTDGNFLSASILNNDLYAYNGAYFTPNGIRFHSKRPLYKSYPAIAAGNVTAGNWGRYYGNAFGDAGVLVDTGALYGIPMDKNYDGQMQGNVPGAGGGNLNGSPTRANGGVYLMSAFTTGNGNVTAVGSGLGPQPLAAGPTTSGTRQQGNSAHVITPFVVDLVDGATQIWTPYLYNGDASTALAPYAGNSDGSGLGGRTGAHWASVYTAFGATVGSAPAPVTSWTGQSINAALLNGNTGLHDILRFFNMPPFFRNVNNSPSQSLSANTPTTITLGAIGAGDYDPYSGWNGSGVWTVPFSGLYLIHGVVGFEHFTGAAQAGVQIAGTNYWGPGMPTPSTNQVTATKTQIFSLNAGDTVRLVAQTSVGSSVATLWPPRMLILYLTGQGTPSTLPTPPDITYRWVASAPADISPLLNAHIANDLTLLAQKPYLMAYQTNGQSGIAQGVNTTLSFDTNSGQVHGDNGDNYSGWNSGTSTYTAQRAGWYLAVLENCLIFPTLTSTPVVSALFSVSPSGGANAWDVYQQCGQTGSGFHPGATALGYYYLRAGDTIKAGILTQDSASGTTSTATGSNTTSHFELVWVSE